MNIREMDGITFEMTESIARKLRDDAIEAAIDAEVKKEKWERATVILASENLRKKFGRWIVNAEGVLRFSDRDLPVKILRIKAPFWKQTEPQVVYIVKFKSGKFGKTEHLQDVSYFLDFFTPSG